MEIFEEQTDEWSSEVRPITFLEDKQIPHLPAPLVRVNCCGLLSLEVLTQVVSNDPPRGRYRIIATQTLRGRGAVPALMLLKLLVSQPHRFASNDWLSTQMQQEMERGALVRLDTMASQLRTLLCGLESEQTSVLRLRLVEYLRNGRGSGPGYRLAPYPLIWLDTEALAWNVEQAARMQRFGEDALPWWERAYALASRGAYLPDDPYSEWAADKRAEVEGALRQSVHALARLYLAQQGEAGAEEALRLLRSYWLSRKTDEDALRPLMELLGKNERYQEAEAYYQQCLRALREEGERMPDPRTQDLREFLRTKQLRREQMTLPLINSAMLPETSEKRRDTRDAFTPPSSPFLHTDQRHNPLLDRVNSEVEQAQAKHLPSASIETPKSIQSSQLASLFQTQTPSFAVWSSLLQESQKELATAQEQLYVSLEVEIMAMTLRWKHPTDLVVLLQQLAYDLIRKYDAMHKDHSDHNTNITRRHVLQAIAMFPIQMYGLTYLVSEERPLPLNHVLPSCAAGITACWELRRYESDGLFTIQRILSAYLPTLEQVARQSSSYQSAAACLASQGYLLVNVLAEHYGKPDHMEAAARQARFYGQCAQDVNLEVSALIRLAIKFDYEHNDMKALETYQEALALPTFSTVSPLLQGRVYAGLAGTYAYCSQTTQALSFLSQAKEVYPNEPEADPTYPFALCDNNTLALWEGLTLKHVDNCTDAFSAFTRFGKLTPFTGLLELNRVEHLNYAASVAIKQRELDAAALYLDAAEGVAWHIQDATRLSEVRDSLRSMRLLWPDEAKVKTLQEKFAARRPHQPL